MVCVGTPPDPSSFSKTHRNNAKLPVIPRSSMMVFFILLQLFFLDACYAQDDSGQSIAEEYGRLPQCSLTCFDNASQGINCDPADYTCICQSYNEASEETVVSSVASCIQNTCSTGNITTTFTLFNHICIIVLDAPATDWSSVPQTTKTFSFGVSSTLAISSTTLTTISTSKTTSENFTAMVSSHADTTSNSLSVSSTQSAETKGASSPPGVLGISSNTLKPQVVAGIILAFAGFLLALAIGSRLILRRKIRAKFRWKKDFRNLSDDGPTHNVPGSGGNLPSLGGVQVSHEYSVTSQRISTPQTSVSVQGNALPPTAYLSRYGTQRRSGPLSEILEESPSEATSSGNVSPSGLTARPSQPRFPISPNQRVPQKGEYSHRRFNSQDLDLPFDIPDEKPDIPPRSPYRSSMAVSPLTPFQRREVAGDPEREYFPGPPSPNLMEGNEARDTSFSYPFEIPSRATSTIMPEPQSHFSVPSSTTEPLSSRQSSLLTNPSSTTSKKFNRLTFPQSLTSKHSLFNPNNSSHTSMPLPLPPSFHLTPYTPQIPNFSLPPSKRRKSILESSKSGSLGLPLQGSMEKLVQDQVGRSFLLENSEESKSENGNGDGDEWSTLPEMPMEEVQRGIQPRTRVV
ncbi:hypothetical protein B7494_g1643 [Chlorociboria aeruginascens]|nr:hypothetical protein B7494_g1643 [Chlorociboria aeruginascens]